MKEQMSKNIIKFSYYHEGYSSEDGFGCFPETKLEYQIDSESNIREVCRSFENFLLACGYRLNPGETIGIIEDYD